MWRPAAALRRRPRHRRSRRRQATAAAAQAAAAETAATATATAAAAATPTAATEPAAAGATEAAAAELTGGARGEQPGGQNDAERPGRPVGHRQDHPPVARTLRGDRDGPSTEAVEQVDGRNGLDSRRLGGGSEALAVPVSTASAQSAADPAGRRRSTYKRPTHGDHPLEVAGGELGALRLPLDPEPVNGINEPRCSCR